MIAKLSHDLTPLTTIADMRSALSKKRLPTKENLRLSLIERKTDYLGQSDRKFNLLFSLLTSANIRIVSSASISSDWRERIRRWYRYSSKRLRDRLRIVRERRT
ncbi:hypothetical protein D3H35_00345 [Cohnella faecalis]|uniref:Uncharacterized protein n=1 Tax=Cohnella faecalis TaxID=2315694 RepID=A0A398CSE3_9BACL|nr:hypothetical protein D3H35_00345 [Cohnella faecalis]